MDERLLRRLPPNRLRPLLFAPDLADEVSGASAGAFLSELKASLNRLPGDALRRLLFGSAGTSNARLDWVGRLDCRSP